MRTSGACPVADGVLPPAPVPKGRNQTRLRPEGRKPPQDGGGRHHASVSNDSRKFRSASCDAGTRRVRIPETLRCPLVKDRGAGSAPRSLNCQSDSTLRTSSPPVALRRAFAKSCSMIAGRIERLRDPTDCGVVPQIMAFPSRTRFPAISSLIFDGGSANDPRASHRNRVAPYNRWQRVNRAHEKSFPGDRRDQYRIESDGADQARNPEIW